MLCQEIMVIDPKVINDNEKMELMFLLTDSTNLLDLYIKLGLSPLTRLKNYAKHKNKSNTNKAEEIKRPLSIINDWDMIYSAFIKNFNIDINNCELDYKQFKALLTDVRECLLLEVMKARTIDLSKVKDKDERKRLRDLAEKYKLDDYQENSLLEEFNKKGW